MKNKWLFSVLTVFFLISCAKNDVVLDYGVSTLISTNSILDYVFDNNINTSWKPLTYYQNNLIIHFKKPTFISKLEILGNNIKTSVFEGESKLGYAELYKPLEINRSVEQLKLFFNVKYSDNSTYEISEIRIFDKNNRIINIPQKIRTKIRSSSTLKPDHLYLPGFACDGLLNTAWSEGNTNNSGKGEWIELVFHNEVKADRIYLANGFQKNKRLFYENCRIKSLTLNFDDNIENITIPVKDIMGFQSIQFGKSFSFRKIRLVINDIIQGGKYNDLTISEIVLGNKEGMIYPDGDNEVIKANALKESITNSFISNIINKEFICQNEYYYSDDPYSEQPTGTYYYNLSVYFSDNGIFNINQIASGLAVSKGGKINSSYIGKWSITSVENGAAELKLIGERTLVKDQLLDQKPIFNQFIEKCSVVIKIPVQEDFFSMTEYSMDIKNYIEHGKTEIPTLLIIGPYFTNIIVCHDKKDYH